VEVVYLDLTSTAQVAQNACISMVTASQKRVTGGEKEGIKKSKPLMAAHHPSILSQV